MSEPDAVSPDERRNSRDLEREELIQEFKDMIREELADIEFFLSSGVYFDNIIKLRTHAQNIIDYCNRRLNGK